MRQHCKWSTNFHSLLAFDFLINWNIECFYRTLGRWLIVVEGEETTLLPWPECFVHYFDLCDKSSAWIGFKYTFWFRLQFCSEIVPRVAFVVWSKWSPGLTRSSWWSLLLHLLSKCLHCLAKLLPLLLLFVFSSSRLHGLEEFLVGLLTVLFSSHLGHKALHHFHETFSSSHTTTSSAKTSSATSSATTTTTTTLTEGFIAFSLNFWRIFWNHSQHNLGNFIWFPDFEKRVLMV